MNRAGGHFKVLSAVAVLGACLGLIFAPAPAARAVTIDEQTRTVTASRLSMAFSTVGPDVVNEVKWTDSAGVQGSNLVEGSGETTCGGATLKDPANFWGESYGTGEGSNPKLVYDGSAGTWTSPASDRVLTSTEYPTACSQYPAAVPVSTTYTYYDEAPAANEIMVQRTWRFDLASPPFGNSKSLRAYVPQLPLARYGRVIFPSGGSLRKIEASQCSSGLPCLEPLPAGWFAIEDATAGDPGLGSGVIVLRDAGDSASGELAIQGLERPGPANLEPVANISSVALEFPPGGLISALSETEYLCFYDATSWPQAQREALELPAGCGPVAAPAQGGGTGGGAPSGGNSASGGGGGGSGAPGPPRPLPAPVLGHNFNVAPAGGTVRVLLSSSHTFTALTQAQQIPFGSIVDATHGIVTIVTAAPHGGTQTGQFFDGEFVLRQGRSGEVVAVLAGGNFSVCPTARERGHVARIDAARGGARIGAARASGGHTVRKLWANAHGKFSTQGNYAAGAVQGTEWLTEDRCDGTLIRVTRDRVAVTNLVTHRHLSVHAGHSYFAKAP